LVGLLKLNLTVGKHKFSTGLCLIRGDWECGSGYFLNYFSPRNTSK